MNIRAMSAAFTISLLAFPIVASAAKFPDVPGDHPYNSPIEALVLEGVLTGNPDGNFYPARPVNRAEFLTMLYRATKKTPSAVSTSCFRDVAAAAWYANVVCDAVANGFVNGYPDGSFKPEQSVSRIEALKMVYKVFGFAIVTGDDANGASKDFTDVQAGQWYVTYITSSYRNGLLPVAGYPIAGKFYPSNALLRGEAAAYVWRAMNISGDLLPTSYSSSSAMTSVPSSSSSRAAQTSSASSVSRTATLLVDFPFSDDGNVDGRTKFVYDFSLASPTDISVFAKLGSSNESGVSCRLYVLGDDGLSQEYYLGYEDAFSCSLKVSAPKGKLQLAVLPRDPNATYTVTTKTTKGDGNDGFDEAVKLEAGKSKGNQLGVSDYFDWYSFSLSQKGAHVVQSFGEDVECVIYPLKDVDVFGFTGPACGEAYEYPKGSYMVEMRRKNGVDKALNYSVQLD